MLKFDETASYSFVKETALIADIKESSVAAQYQYVHSICHFRFICKTQILQFLAPYTDTHLLQLDHNSTGLNKTRENNKELHKKLF